MTGNKDFLTNYQDIDGGFVTFGGNARCDIMISVCACSRFQVQPKVSHLNAVKRIFRYLKGRPNLGLWYPKDSPFILEAFSDSDYAGASLDRKSTTRGCQFLGSRLISWQCKKQTVVANSTTEAEYIAASHCCGQVLWIQNQMLDYGYNFMQTKIHVDNESAICVVKNPVYHSKTKHIEIRHHFIRDSYEKRLIEMVKIHTDNNVADLLTKAFDVKQSSMLIWCDNKQLEVLSGMDYNWWQSQAPRNHGGALAQTRSKRVLEKPNELPLPEGHTSESGESSMEHTFKLMDIIPPTPHDSPLIGSYTPGSNEGRLKLKELMAICTKLSKQVIDLEKEKDAQAVEILKLKKRVKKLERQRKSSISHPRRRIYRQVESSNDDLDEEDASKQGRTSDKTKPMFKDSDFDDLDDLVDEGMAFVQEKDAENQGKIGADDTEAVNTAGEGVSTAAPRTPPTTTIVFDDEDVTMAMAQTLIKMKEEKAKEKGVAIKDVEDFSRPIRSITTLQPLPTIDPKDKGKGILQETEPVEKTKKKVQGDAQIERDAEVALRLQAELDEELRARIDVDYELAARMTQEEQEKYTIEERARLLAEFFERRKKQLAAERAEAIRNKPPTKTQLRNLMMTYLKNMGGYKHSQLKGKSYEEIQGLYERQQKRIQDFTPMDSEKEAQKPAKRLKRVAGSYATQKSPKKPKVMKSAKDVTEEEATEYEKEKEELRLSLKIISNDDSEVNYEPLSKKFPIMNWEYQLLGKMKEKDMYVYRLTSRWNFISYHGDTQAILRSLTWQTIYRIQLVLSRKGFRSIS
ncbi:hypothetical protein Tco_1080882 [Tanacetum coccineum]|uniref:Uncharacterized protein n=1 Tax=Tanacetum coccineum TaxID=301880 RepID=A0ABQ5HXL6_9ASTR